MSAFSAIDLSALPPLELHPVDFAAELELVVGRLSAAHAALADTIGLESDPARKIAEEIAFLRGLANSAANHAIRQGMLATASGSALDHLAGIVPLLREPGESDDDFRARIQFAPEGFSVAGPVAGYIFHVLRGVPGLLDLTVETRQDTPDLPPGEVHLYVLDPDQPGSDASHAAVSAVLSEDIVPDTDLVRVMAPAVTAYDVEAELTFEGGPGKAEALARAEAAVRALAAARTRINAGINRAELTAAIIGPGVVNCTLVQPAADIAAVPRTAPVLGAVSLTEAQA